MLLPGLPSLLLASGKYDLDAQSYFSASSTAVPNAHKDAVDAYVRAMKLAGLWSAATFLYIEAMQDAQVARTDLRNPAYKFVVGGQANHIPLYGWVGGNSILGATPNFGTAGTFFYHLSSYPTASGSSFGTASGSNFSIYAGGGSYYVSIGVGGQADVPGLNYYKRWIMAQRGQYLDVWRDGLALQQLYTNVTGATSGTILQNPSGGPSGERMAIVGAFNLTLNNAQAQQLDKLNNILLYTLRGVPMSKYASLPSAWYVYSSPGGNLTVNQDAGSFFIGDPSQQGYMGQVEVPMVGPLPASVTLKFTSSMAQSAQIGAFSNSGPDGSVFNGALVAGVNTFAFPITHATKIRFGAYSAPYQISNLTIE